MNRDFLELLAALRTQGVRFIVIGAHALAAHGFPRAKKPGRLGYWPRSKGWRSLSWAAKV